MVKCLHQVFFDFLKLESILIDPNHHHEISATYVHPRLIINVLGDICKSLVGTLVDTYRNFKFHPVGRVICLDRPSPKMDLTGHVKGELSWVCWSWSLGTRKHGHIGSTAIAGWSDVGQGETMAQGGLGFPVLGATPSPTSQRHLLVSSASDLYHNFWHFAFWVGFQLIRWNAQRFDSLSNWEPKG